MYRLDTKYTYADGQSRKDIPQGWNNSALTSSRWSSDAKNIYFSVFFCFFDTVLMSELMKFVSNDIAKTR